MSKATDAVSNPPQVVCECGRDHEETDNHKCPVFEILDRLNRGIGTLVVYQEAFEFGKNGAMAACLQNLMMVEYKNVMKDFTKYQDVSEQHPEWYLAEEVSRLRGNFDRATRRCAEEKEAMRHADYDCGGMVEPEISRDDEPTLRRAKQKTIDCYLVCYDLVDPHVGAEALSSDNPDHNGLLLDIDAAFRNAMDAILDLPRTDNANIHDLSSKVYEVWKDSRRLLCDFKPTSSLITHPGSG